MSGQPDPKGVPRIVDRTATKRAVLTYRACLACGQPASNGHHVLAVGRGQSGDDVVENIVSLCGSGSMGCHGAFHGTPYVVEKANVITALVGRPWTKERRDREWVARRIGERLLEQRPDVVDYVLGKLGDEPGRAFLKRTYHLTLPAAMMPR